jgi:sugar phosphate isomerase/epimerase
LKFSLSTGTLYPYPLRTVFRWARLAGFDGVELVVNPEAIVRGGQKVGQLAHADGLKIFSVHPSVVPLPGWWERHGGLEPTIHLAQEAGASFVVMHTPRLESLETGEGLAFSRQIKVWQQQMATSGLQLAMENKAIHAQAHRRYALSPLERLRAFVDGYDLKLVLDTSHAGSAGEGLEHARQLFGGRLVNVHLSDMGGRVPLPSVKRMRMLFGEHRFPGTGDLPLAGLLASLANDQYNGLVTLEVSPFAAQAWWPPAIRRRLARAIAWMKQAAASHQTDRHSPSTA